MDKQVLGIYSYIDEIGGVLYAMRERNVRVDHFAPGGLT